MKKTQLSFFVAALSLTCSQVFAAPITHTIQLEASIPTAEFLVTPVLGDWIGTTQQLMFNPVTGNLGSLTKVFQAVNTAGPISAVLTAVPSMTASNNSAIALDVKFNGKPVTVTKSNVVLADDAATAKNYNLQIVPVRPTTGGGKYAPGDYLGTVQIMFDAEITPRESVL